MVQFSDNLIQQKIIFMRLVVQRVKESRVHVDGACIGQIEKGLLVYLGIHRNDTFASIPWMVNKLINLRIFEDAQGKMNLSLKETGGEVLVVSQFTLYGNCANGRRPDFLEAARPAEAEALYNQFVEEVRKELGRVQTGQFQATMEVYSINDGPVTFWIEK